MLIEWTQTEIIKLDFINRSAYKRCKGRPRKDGLMMCKRS